MRTKSNSRVLEQARGQQVAVENHGDYTESEFKRDFKEGKVVGRGVWGVVSNVCTRKNARECNALKRVRVRDTSDFQTADMDYQYLYYLKRVFLKKYRIVPLAERMWISTRDGTKMYNLLMSKYDGNMHYLCVDERPRKLKIASKAVLRDYPRHNGIYYRSELLRMYAIAWLIGQKGVIHGDLKPDQYLFNYRSQTKAPVQDIALTDFGFAGLVSDVRHIQNRKVESMWKTDAALRNAKKFPITAKKFGLAEMGWPSNEKSPNSFGVCKSGLIQLDTKKEASLMNLAHLETFLISDGARIPTFIIDDRLPVREQSLMLYTGVHKFLSAMLANPGIRSWYPSKFFTEYEHCVREWKREPHLFFTLEEIIASSKSK